MQQCNLIIKDGIHFTDHLAVLTHLGETLITAGVVKESYPAALVEREKVFPTGIALDGYAVAIPHCEAEHAIEPTIYLIRPSKSVPFYRADDDGTVDASLIIALVVTDPADQLVLLRSLFTQLQDAEFYQNLIDSSVDDMKTLFEQKIFKKA